MNRANGRGKVRARACGSLLGLVCGFAILGCGGDETPEEVCTPACEGRVCGDDGCGGRCGECDFHEVCIDGERCEDGCISSGFCPLYDFVLLEGDASPCLGASRVKLHLGPYQGSATNEDYRPGEVLFDGATGRCVSLRFDGARLLVGLAPFAAQGEVWDSTDEVEGRLAFGLEAEIYPQVGAPPSTVEIRLDRKASCSGAVVVWDVPADFGSAESEVAKLGYSVGLDGADEPMREGQIALGPDPVRDHFPLTIANLPWPDRGASIVVVLTGRSAGGRLVRSWRGTAPYGSDWQNPVPVELRWQ